MKKVHPLPISYAEKNITYERRQCDDMVVNNEQSAMKLKLFELGRMQENIDKSDMKSKIVNYLQNSRNPGMAINGHT